MSTRFEPSSIKNKVKRGEVVSKSKKTKRQAKLRKRLEQAKVEATDPLVKKRRLAENVPHTLDNTRQFDPSALPTDPSSSIGGLSTPHDHAKAELAIDVETDPFSTYFDSATDPLLPPKVLITTSPRATRTTYEFCDELVGVFPGAEFIRRPNGYGFEIGNIAGWATGRGFKHLCIVNENTKKPNALTVVHLPAGPTAFFKLTSIELTKHIFGHARATPHNPELVLNNFSTRLGHAIGRMFQTFFPPMPEFQGRQVVTLHNQRDFLFFRRHRYAFRSPEKVALQEIGPRFTLKLRWLKKGLPVLQNKSEMHRSLDFAADTGHHLQLDDATAEAGELAEDKSQAGSSSQSDEYLWLWKPELETSRRTFFL